MSRVRYYFDDDVGQTHLVRYLRELGIDCITSLEAGTFGASDEEHLNESAALGRVICTGNRRDFSALSAELLTRGDSPCWNCADRPQSVWHRRTRPTTDQAGG